MIMQIAFPGGVEVDAHFRGQTVLTDQPEKGGGQNLGPQPFDLFLASIGTCAGFCKQHCTCPFACEKLLKALRFLLVSTDLFDHFCSTVSQAVVKHKSDICANKILAGCKGNCFRHSTAAPICAVGPGSAAP